MAEIAGKKHLCSMTFSKGKYLRTVYSNVLESLAKNSHETFTLNERNAGKLPQKISKNSIFIKFIIEYQSSYQILGRKKPCFLAKKAK